MLFYSRSIRIASVHLIIFSFEQRLRGAECIIDTNVSLIAVFDMQMNADDKTLLDLESAPLYPTPMIANTPTVELSSTIVNKTVFMTKSK